MSEDKHPLRIRYEYAEDSGVMLHYAHGVWGGINPHGEVEMNFYTESDKLPPFSEQMVTPDGSFGHETTPCDRHLKVVTRRVHSKLILNYHTVKAVIEWLQEKADALESENGEAFFFGEGNDFRQ
jgi:hypothetical protein